MYNNWFNIRKAAQVVAFFLASGGGRLHIVKLSKLVYLSDRLSMDKYEYPITFDDLGSMRFGPVNSLTRRYLIDEYADLSGYWHMLVGYREENDIPLAKSQFLLTDLDQLSDAEISVLSEVWMKFGHMAEFELADWTHRFVPEWRDPSGSYIPITFTDVFRALGKPDPMALNYKVLEERELISTFNQP